MFSDLVFISHIAHYFYNKNDKLSNISMKLIVFTALTLFSNICVANLANFVHTRETQFWQELYTEPYHTLYCAIHKKPTEKSTVTHVYPLDWMAVAMNCPSVEACDFARFKDASSDLHNLWPIEKKMLSKRKHYVFLESNDSTSKGKKSDCNFITYDKGVEPREWAKGEIARSMLYIIWKYRLPDFEQIPLMVKWATTYPPNAEEKWRNQKIIQLQRNENPFISSPEKVAEIFGENLKGN